MRQNQIEIKNVDDYRRVKAERQDALDAVVQMARKAKWNNGQLIEELTKAALPYDLALTDPNNTLATRIGLETVKTELLNDGIVIKPINQDENPRVKQLVEDYTARLNRDFGIHYLPPSIYVASNLLRRKHTPASFVLDGDVMLIDEAVLKSPVSNAYYESVAGHELGHRYERFSGYFPVRIKLAFMRELKV